MAEGQVLATAIVRFVADDTAYKASQATILESSQVMATSVGAVASAEENVALSGVNAATGIKGVGAAANVAAPATSLLADATRETHKELFEAEKLTRTFVDAALAAVPGIGGMTGEFTRLSRETGGFTVAMVAVTTGLLAAVVVFGEFVKKTAELREAQLAANAAVDSMDFAGALSGFNKAAEASRNYSNAIEITQHETGNLSDFLKDFEAELAVVKGWLGNTTEVTSKWGEAVLETWESFGQGKAILDTEIVQLQALAKAGENLAATATSADALNAALRGQADALSKAAADTVKLKELQDEQYYAGRKNKIDEVATFEEAENLFELDTEMALRKQTREALTSKNASDDTARRLADAKKVADVVAQQITDEGKLADIQATSAEQAAKAAIVEADARQANATEIRNYYGQLLTGSADYQAKRLADTQAEMQMEIVAVRARYESEIQAETARRDALPIYSNEWRAEDRKIQISVADRNAKLADLNDKMAQEAIQGEGKITAAKQAELDRQQQLATANFNLLKAQGFTNVQDEIAFSAQKVSVWQQDGTKRIAAETEVYNQVKKLHDDLASVGASLQDRAIAALKEQGIEYGSLADVQQKMLELHQQDIQLQTQYTSGGNVQLDQLGKIRDASRDWATLTEKQATASEAIQISLANTNENLSGIKPTATQIADDLDRAGVAGANFNDILARGAVAGLAEAQAIDTMMEEGRKWNEQFNKASDTGEQFKTGFKAGFDDALTEIDYFYTAADAKIKAGNSRLADTVYFGLIDRLKNAIDAEALAS